MTLAFTIALDSIQGRLKTIVFFCLDHRCQRNSDPCKDAAVCIVNGVQNVCLEMNGLGPEKNISSICFEENICQTVALHCIESSIDFGEGLG